MDMQTKQKSDKYEGRRGEEKHTCDICWKHSREQIYRQTDRQAGRRGRGKTETTGVAKQSKMEDDENLWADDGRTRAMKGEMQDERRTRQEAE
jgi:hypothetical protein